MIPKKLDKLASTEELIVWLNELRDFLQAKEEASKPHKKNCKFMASAGYEACDCKEASKGDNSLFNDKKLNECANILANDDMDKIKEASNGECPHCDEKHMDGYAHNPKTCFMCRDNPPEHKCDHKTNYFMNAVNGCKVCSKKAQKALSRDGEPEHEDEWEEFDNYFKDLGFHNLPLHQDIRDEVKDYIKSNFVPKSKIKRLLGKDVLKYLED